MAKDCRRDEPLCQPEDSSIPAALNINTRPLVRRTFQTAGPVRVKTLYLSLVGPPSYMSGHYIQNNCGPFELKSHVYFSRIYSSCRRPPKPPSSDSYLGLLWFCLKPRIVARRRPPDFSTIYGFVWRRSRGALAVTPHLGDRRHVSVSTNQNECRSTPNTTTSKLLIGSPFLIYC